MDYHKQKKFFNKAYSLGARRISSGYGWPLEVDLQVKKFLKVVRKTLKSGQALDIGCGQGRHTIFFAQNGFASHGIDYLARPIKEARLTAKKNQLTNTHFHLMDVLKLNLPKNSFDLVLDWSVLDHIIPKDWPLYLKNILTVLKINGFMILTEFSVNDHRVKDKFQNYFMDRNSYDHFFKLSEIKKLFSKNFEIIKTNETVLKTHPSHLMLNILMQRKV